MMNKKIAQAILIVGVLCIWGMIAYRLLKNREISADYTLPVHTLVDDKPRKPIEEVKLALNYEDPFLKKSTSVSLSIQAPQPIKHSTKTHSDKPSSTQAPPPAPIKWPEITFKGIIENKKKGEVLGIISINNGDRIIKKLDPFGEFVIENIQKDQIVLKHGSGEMKVYLKK